MTDSGFGRVSCNSGMVRHSLTALDAVAVVGKLAGLGSRAFWPMDQPIVKLANVIGSSIEGYFQITDAVFLAAAVQRRGQPASLDVSLKRLVDGSKRSCV